jgi:hypothetical protein
MDISYPAVDVFETIFDPAGGTRFDLADQHLDQTFVTYLKPRAELQVPRNTFPLDHATLGFYYDDQIACFFAATPSTPVDDLAQFNEYSGVADGLAQIGGITRRLFGSKAVLTYSASAGNYALDLDLEGLPDAFADPQGQTAAPLGKVTGVLVRNGREFSNNVSGPSGFSGTIDGRLGANGYGAVFVFDLRNAAGDRIFGSIATDLLAVL